MYKESEIRDPLILGKKSYHDITKDVARPVEGKANKELIEVLAKEYKIPKKNVEIVSGFNSKNKTVKLVGVKDRS